MATFWNNTSRGYAISYLFEDLLEINQTLKCVLDQMSKYQEES